MRPSLLDDLGLVAALRWYVDRQAQRAEFAATFAADPIEIRLSPDIEIVCFRVAQEALTNIARHARARQVWVTLRRSDTELHLVIRDDGVGFDMRTGWEHTGSGGNLGLLGMQERVALLGGQLEIQSAPTQGTEIQARFPLIAFPRWEKERRREGERGRR